MVSRGCSNAFLTNMFQPQHLLNGFINIINWRFQTNQWSLMAKHNWQLPRFHAQLWIYYIAYYWRLFIESRHGNENTQWVLRQSWSTRLKLYHYSMNITHKLGSYAMGEQLHSAANKEYKCLRMLELRRAKSMLEAHAENLTTGNRYGCFRENFWIIHNVQTNLILFRNNTNNIKSILNADVMNKFFLLQLHQTFCSEISKVYEYMSKCEEGKTLTLLFDCLQYGHFSRISLKLQSSLRRLSIYYINTYTLVFMDKYIERDLGCTTKIIDIHVDFLKHVSFYRMVAPINL